MAKRKRRTHLEMLVQNDEKELYEITEGDCLRWFDILNRELFENSLKPFDEISIGRRRGFYGIYEYHDDDKNKDYHYSKLLMKKSYKTKKLFVEVLAHEMVHHYQALYNEPIGHGPSFYRWREKFTKKGLRLVKVFKE